MEKENKYYTPEISGFYIGFECEFKNKMQSNKWEHTICDTELINIAFDSHEHEEYDDKFEDNFRVKYLDKEDIESLGYESMIPMISYYDSYMPKSLTMVDCYINIPHIKGACIFIYSDIAMKKIIFVGIIKNKSELKKLLTQLGI